MTSTSRSAIVSPQVAWADTAWKLFVCPQAPNIGPKGVNRRGHAVEDSETVKDTQHDLEAHSAVAPLDAHQRLTIDAGSVGQLVLGQAAQLAPRLHMAADVAQRAPDRKRGRGRRHNVLSKGHYTT
jgi:hypothetical protein